MAKRDPEDRPPDLPEPSVNHIRIDHQPVSFCICDGESGTGYREIVVGDRPDEKSDLGIDVFGRSVLMVLISRRQKDGLRFASRLHHH
jgi:hypothetical protein